jgi:hypothetical protein
MPFTNSALDEFFAQDLSLLTSCDAPDLSKEFDQANFWVQKFILNSIFNTNVVPKWRPHFFGILRRAQMALVEYEDGRNAPGEYLKGPKDRVSLSNGLCACASMCNG